LRKPFAFHSIERGDCEAKQHAQLVIAQRVLVASVVIAGCFANQCFIVSPEGKNSCFRVSGDEGVIFAVCGEASICIVDLQSPVAVKDRVLELDVAQLIVVVGVEETTEGFGEVLFPVIFVFVLDASDVDLHLFLVAW
jgi:hypothetical protein